MQKQDCLGTRELISEEDEKQPSGKVFKKVRLIYIIYIFFATNLEHFQCSITECSFGVCVLGGGDTFKTKLLNTCTPEIIDITDLGCSSLLLPRLSKMAGSFV